MAHLRDISKTATVISAALFGALSLFRFGFSDFSRYDALASQWLSAGRVKFVTDIIVSFTEFFSVAVVSVLGAALFGALWLGGKRFYAALFLFSLAGGSVLFTFFKLAYGAARPEAGLVNVTSTAYPSGHATIVAVLMLFAAFLYERTRRAFASRVLFYSFISCMIVAVAVSRVYLGVHWLSDVIGGVLLGAFCFFAAYLVLSRAYETN